MEGTPLMSETWLELSRVSHNDDIAGFSIFIDESNFNLYTKKALGYRRRVAMETVATIVPCAVGKWRGTHNGVEDSCNGDSCNDRSIVPCVCRGKCRDKRCLTKASEIFTFYLTVFIPGKNLSGFIQKIRIV
jgi:hypothetical protein